MCHDQIEKFACGHEEKHKIPCETFCDQGNCNKPEDDKTRDKVDPKCTKCKDDDEETDFIQEELRKFAEAESLKPAAAVPKRSRDPNAPKLYFKRCIVWSRCGQDLANEYLEIDHSHSRPSDIERDEVDPEYLPIEGMGNCFDCSAASSSTIAQMKQNGDYEKTDPWGAMTRPEVGEGSSRDVASPTLENIATGVDIDPKKELAQKSSQVSLTSSPERAEDRSASAMPSNLDYDASPSKGKGRVSQSTHPLAQVASAEDDESDEEKVDQASKHSARPADTDHENAGADAGAGVEEDTDDDEEGEEEAEDEAGEEEEKDGTEEEAHPQPNNLNKVPGRPDEEDDRAHFSADESAENKGHHGDRPIHRDVGEGERADSERDAGSDDKAGEELASPEELKAAGLSGKEKISRTEAQRRKDRMVEVGQIALMQPEKGLVE
ncbi:MAG: hypothetical protein Q9170_000720 [Blastenia crenularia]